MIDFFNVKGRRAAKKEIERRIKLILELLRKNEGLYENGLISEEEYKKRKEELMNKSII